MREQKRFTASTLLIVSAVVGAGAFAAGRSIHTDAPPPSAMPLAAAAEEPPSMTTESTSTALPPGHPPVDTTGAMPSMPSSADTAESTLEWKVPPRWQIAPNTSSMRLATYRVPPDGEMSVSQAGGSVDANAERWIAQFGPDAKKTAKRTTKKVAGLNVTIVEVTGTFGDKPSWGLLGAIVETPGMPHFFKLTGPAKTIEAARPDLDQLIASFKTK